MQPPPNNDQLSTYNTPVTTQTGDVIHSMNDELSIYTVEGFYFLEPMVNNSEYSGTFDPGLSPVVEVCETPSCIDLHVSFDTDGAGSERVRLVEEDEHYNQYIGGWNTAKVSNMEAMFFNATAFNQNLSGWCVSLIPSVPFRFVAGTSMPAANLPLWGTCPS
jgi:hypothetical protein